MHFQRYIEKSPCVRQRNKQIFQRWWLGFPLAKPGKPDQVRTIGSILSVLALVYSSSSHFFRKRPTRRSTETMECTQGVVTNLGASLWHLWPFFFHGPNLAAPQSKSFLLTPVSDAFRSLCSLAGILGITLHFITSKTIRSLHVGQAGAILKCPSKRYSSFRCRCVVPTKELEIDFYRRFDALVFDVYNLQLCGIMPLDHVVQSSEVVSAYGRLANAFAKINTIDYSGISNEQFDELCLIIGALCTYLIYFSYANKITKEDLVHISPTKGSTQA